MKIKSRIYGKRDRGTLFLITILVFTFLSCKKEDKYTPPSDPTKAILGKWEAIEMGNWPDMKPIKDVGYKEYLLDSILREFDYKTQTYTFIKKYWIDTLLHEGTYYNGRFVETTYTYKFYEDKLRLDLNAFAIYNTFIFKRIK